MAKININTVDFIVEDWSGAARANKSQFTVGNDRPIPESAYKAGSYMDGIYQEFDPEVAPNGWASIQDTFKMALPQDKWTTEMDASTISGFRAGAIFADEYNTAKSVQVDEAFDLPASGRSTYVDGVDTKFPE